MIDHFLNETVPWYTASMQLSLGAWSSRLVSFIIHRWHVASWDSWSISNRQILRNSIIMNHRWMKSNNSKRICPSIYHFCITVNEWINDEPFTLLMMTPVVKFKYCIIKTLLPMITLCNCIGFRRCELGKQLGYSCCCFLLHHRSSVNAALGISLGTAIAVHACLVCFSLNNNS